MSEERLPDRRRSERASALVLIPAMALVVIALAAITIDLSLVHSAHRSVHRIASAAADDAAAMLDERELQRSGEVAIDPIAARRVVDAHLAAASLPGELVEVATRIDGSGTVVQVTVVVDVDHVALPDSPPLGTAERLTVTARGRLQR